MKKTLYLMIISALAVSFTACNKVDDAEYVSADELGTTTKSVTVPASEGTFLLNVVANKLGTAVSMDDCKDWLGIADNRFDADKTLIVEHLRNDGFPRTGRILLDTGTRMDTVFVYQEGKPESFFFPTTAVVVYNGKGNTIIETDLSMPLRQVDIDVRYLDGEGWIEEYGLNNGHLWLKTVDNTDEVNLRHAQIVVSWKDGWMNPRSQVLSVTQANARNLLGIPVTFKELCAMATTGGYEIEEEVYTVCHVGGSPSHGQAGSCDVQDILSGTCDFDSNDLTSYIQAEDGNGGIRITTFSKEDNIFRRGTQATIMLKGATITRTEDEPVRYHLTNVKANMLMEARDVEIPAKVKYMSELTDDDVYTYVTLRDCEIPMRKGPLTPINEGYAKEFGYGFIGKYPMLIRDREGSSMYMMTNMTCDYRRDGRPMPAGSGNISGILVHEYYRSFVDRDNAVERYCGNIGRYQIRHLCREDINLSQNFEDSFSGLITEFRYLRQPAAGTTTSLPMAILASAGNGEMTHSYEGYKSVLNLRTTNFSASFFYLGPVGSAYKNQYKNGCGIIEEDGSDYAVKYVEQMGIASQQNTDGKGAFTANSYISWANKYWWDSNTDHAYCWLIKTSTAGISSDNVSMQIAMYNNGQSSALCTKAPRYWKVQYSFVTSDCTKASDSQWNDVPGSSFAIPDVCTWATQQYAQSMGTKVVNIPLPLDVLGRDVVYFRVMPRNNKACSHTATDYYYDSGQINNNSGTVTMDYFAIRYNK